MNIHLKIISSNKLLDLRSKVLRNNASHESCIFEGDLRKNSIHIGAFSDDELVGGISIIKNNSSYKKLKNCYQFRGMCVLKNFQNKGIGNKILLEAENQCKRRNINNVWMNARIKALDFYLKFKYQDLGIRYNIKGIGLHCFLFKKL